jgi:hypothetical protein
LASERRGLTLGCITAHKQKLEEEYDITLRTRRTDAYKALWSSLYLFRLHSRPQMIYYRDIKNAVSKLTEWYYFEGGIFLSEASQKAYEVFIKRLREYDEEHPAGYMEDGDCELERIRDAASTLRTILCKDIGTREESKIPSLYDHLRIIRKRTYRAQDTDNT